MRKKLIGFLAVFACFLMLTGCGSSAGSEEAQEIPQETKSLLFSNTEMTVQQMEQVVTDGTLEDYKDFPVVYSGIQSWESAKKEVGTVDFTTDADGNGSADCFEDVSISVDEDENYIVTVKVTGDKKDANVVAIVLILLSLIIAGFGKFFVSWDKSKAEKARKKDEESKKSSDSFVTAKPAPTQASLAPQAAAGDDALIAVIAAAVSAYREQEEPNVGPDDFVVRKIRRVGRR